MREDYALRYLQKVLQDWSEGKLSTEVAWLRRVSGYKFDSYQDYYAGERFISALIRWLNQFEREDRSFAYQLIREHLIFLSAGEITQLVRRTMPGHFRPILVRKIAHDLEIAPYEIWSTADNVAAYNRLLRRSLFIGLSDGARIDVFRRASPEISNDQVVVNYDLGARKLTSLLKDLRKVDAADARFEMVFLIDDFIGSGTTLCRLDEKEWAGKIRQFSTNIHGEWKNLLTESFQIAAHHYVATECGLKVARESLDRFCAANLDGIWAAKTIELTHSLLLRDSIRFPEKKWPELDTFLEKYYDAGIMTASLRKGGDHVHHGFAGNGLTLVLEHNTPNNSLSIIWAESEGKPKTHRMVPLFRRRERHS